ncbi:DUF2516 family protein [Sinomonas sp. JGH33]|uniref:DUF2516 family protein n=1 Tax=Sinomonas terricola TaxID=3110330 RepID=A0ABU5T9U8_9MICC|nr:DUF2516 family protein [Sinomonas sp. JGH33]MEA5456466.1 DUF2516 family protein [Sinomonas sp. JGH33]
MSGHVLIFYTDFGISFLVSVLCAALTLWALVDCAVRKPRAFEAGSKRTKGFWLGITAAAAFVGVISVLPVPNPFFGMSLFNIAAVTAAGVYLADVRPAVSSR